MRTITVEGKGTSVRQPDWVELKIRASVLKKEFEDSVNSMNEMVNKLKGSLQELGFEKDDLKTVDFDIYQKYNSVEKGIINKEHSSKFKGFEIRHRLRLEFDFDNEKISEVLDCLTDYKEYMSFDMKFTVKDKEDMIREVLKDATRDARFKAEILAESSSVKLGNLMTIGSYTKNYNFVSYTDFETEDYCCGLGSLFGGSNITPKEIEISDKINFIWEIKD